MDIMYYKQAGERYLNMNKKERDNLIDNIVQSLMFVDEGTVSVWNVRNHSVSGHIVTAQKTWILNKVTV